MTEVIYGTIAGGRGGDDYISKIVQLDLTSLDAFIKSYRANDIYEPLEESMFQDFYDNLIKNMPVAGIDKFDEGVVAFGFTAKSVEAAAWEQFNDGYGDDDEDLDENGINGLKEYDANSSEEATSEVAQYFTDYGIELTPAFNFDTFANECASSVYNARVFLCNLEDTSVMQDIANGDYSTFDPEDSSQFNDSYYDMMSDLGLGEDEDEDLDENGINGLEAVGLEKDVMDEAKNTKVVINFSVGRRYGGNNDQTFDRKQRAALESLIDKFQTILRVAIPEANCKRGKFWGGDRDEYLEDRITVSLPSEKSEELNGLLEKINTRLKDAKVELSTNPTESINEQESRNFSLNQRGHNLMVLLANLPISVITTLKALQDDPSFVGNHAITDTYLQDIQNGATPEELIAAKVIFKLEDNNPTENIMENKNKRAEIAELTKKIEEATGKKVVLQEAEKVSSTSVGDLTVEEIIPTDSAIVMQQYVTATLKELKNKIAELETIKFDVSPQARASAEDWKAKTVNVQFSVKQLERISRFVNNTLTAKKFDKNILDKLIALTPEEDTATSAPAMDMSVPPMDMGADLGAPTDLSADLGADAGLPPM